MNHKSLFLPLALWGCFPALGLGEDAFGEPLRINKVEVEQNTLSTTIVYGGGCRHHSFELQNTKPFQPSDTSTMKAQILHDAHGDTCEQLISRTLQFDISEWTRAHSTLTNQNSGTFQIHIEDYGNVEVEYSL
jgi:hypothetical protein